MQRTFARHYCQLSLLMAACLLAISGCERRSIPVPVSTPIAVKAAAPTASVVVPGRVKEDIMFKGIAFDDGDVTSAINALCRANTSSSNCVFTPEYPSMESIYISYGPNNVKVSAQVFATTGGALSRVVIDSPVSIMAMIRTTLADKYGPPLVLPNEANASFEWIDQRGTRIRIGPARKFDIDRLTFESASQILREQKVDEEFRLRARNNL